MRDFLFFAQDQKEARHLKTYDVNEKDKTLNDGSWGAQNLDGASSHPRPRQRQQAGLRIHACLRPSCAANSPEAEPWTPRAGGASLLIPVPAPYGGAVVVGESSVAYVNGGFEGFEV